MSLYKKPQSLFSMWCFYITYLPRKIKRIIWNKYILLWWYRLWIRKDEFHRSLETDIEALMEMNKKEQQKYLDNLIRQREIAHSRDLS